MGLKALTVMTTVGFGIIGLLIWVWFAAYPGGSSPLSTRSRICANDGSRSCMRTPPDGSVLLVDQNGNVRILQPARHPRH